MMNRRRLPLYTFLAIFLAIAVTGLFVVPFLIHSVERSYLSLQGDINERQARAYAQLVEYRLQQGVSEEDVLSEMAVMLRNASDDRGFSCVISQESGNFISHPMEVAIGMPVASKNAEFEDSSKRIPRDRWERVIAKGISADGLLFLPEDQLEVVYMQSIPSVGWTVSTHENTARVNHELAVMRVRLIVGSGLLGFLIAVPASIAARKVSSRYEATIEERNKMIRAEQERSERLLLNILPEPVAQELKSGRQTIAERHSDVTVLFADIVGFTELASAISAEDVVSILNQVFSSFDDLAEKHGLEKIKTIGDAYMVCGGLPEPSGNSAERVVQMALEMFGAMGEVNANRGLDLKLRIGIHTGEVVAGVIGKRKFIYDLWGDTVNIASRMETFAEPDRIQVAEATYEKIQDAFKCESRGEIDVKGKGPLRTYFVSRRV